MRTYTTGVTGAVMKVCRAGPGCLREVGAIGVFPKS